MTSGLVSGEADRAADRTGERVGPYRLVGKLGAGGMGVVYRAVDDRSGQEVALKLLLPEHVGDEQRKKRFLRETSITRALDHPGIARLHDAGEVDGEVFLAMELASGETLARALEAAGDGLAIARAVSLARSVAVAVAHAHDKGIVHRDLKPSNLIAESRDADQVRVLDFGLAKLRESANPAALLYGAETETSVTQEGRILGTPSYMAPEQALGREVGFRADVFSLGVLLYEMLTGVRPFVGASSMEILVSVTRDVPRPPRELRAAIPAPLSALVERCLAKRPEERPTMAELAGDLASPEMLAPTRDDAKARSPVSRRSRSFARPRVVLAAFVSTALVGGVAFLVAHRRPPSSSAALDAGPAVVRLLDLPMPASTSAAALAELRSSRVDESEGDIDAELIKLEHAVKLDPDLATAHLALAAHLAFLEGNRAHAEFAEATKLRHLLTSRERELLDAYRPLFQSEPPAVAASLDRLRALSDRRPGDVPLLGALASAYGAMGKFDEDAATIRRELTLDPHYGAGLSELAQTQAYLGRPAEAYATVERCLSIFPTASWCIWVREFLDSMDGKCAANEADARRRIAADPTIPDGYKALLYAVAAEGKPDALADEALTQTIQRVADPAERARLGLRFTLRLAALRGDFAGAIVHAGELRAEVASRTDVAEHADAAYQSALLEEEVGHPEVAGRLAREYLDRREVWADDPMPHDYSMATDRTSLLASLAFHDHAIDAARYTAILGAYQQSWSAKLQGDYHAFAWVYGYAQPVQTAAEAQEALAALPAFGAVPPWIPNGDVPRLGVGRTFWLAGRDAEGARYIAAAAHGCDAITHPVGWVRANGWLGDVRAKEGDVAAACEAYQVVLAHWGHARPRSVTADHARERSRALGCPAGSAR